MSLLRRNFGYKCLSLIIAILLYWIASGQQNPHVMAEVYVQPDVAGLPSNLVLKTAPQGVPITISGPAAAVSAFKAQERKATVDLSRAHAGTSNYPVQYVMPSGYGNALDIVGPLATQVTLDRKVSAKFFVDVDFDHNATPGYTYDDPRTSPSSVTVEGTAADLAHVQRIAGIVDNTGHPGAISEDVTLIAQDAKSQTVDGVSVIPQQVHVTIGLHRATAVKALVLSIDPVGTPAPGYQIVSYNFAPNAINVSGTTDILAAYSSLKVPVNVEGIRRSEVKEVPVVPPAGLTAVNGRTTVRVRLEVQRLTPSASAPAAPATPAASPASSSTQMPTPPEASPAAATP